MLKITFLGTGTSQGVPVIACKCGTCRSNDMRDKRLRTSALIEINGKNILIDAGPDFRQQLLRENITQLDAILISHEHKDHIGGLDDVRAINYVTGKAIDIYAERRTLNAIESDFAYAFSEERYPGVPEMNLHEINGNTFIVAENIEVIPIRVMHLHLPIYGFRIENLTYITDANSISNSEIEKIKGSQALVLNALRKKKHLSHYSLCEAIDLANNINIPQVYFTHISHQMGRHDVESKLLPLGMHFAYDGLSINIE
jgi:phosphoribosyl 1,2-cyclic phosphate phosphodiesterase